MILWGSEVKHMPLGFTEKRDCPICEKEQQFRLVLDYKYYHFWYFFGAVSEKRFRDICDICHRGTEISPSVAEAQLGFNPIPFLERYGMGLLIVVATLFAVVMNSQP